MVLEIIVLVAIETLLPISIFFLFLGIIEQPAPTKTFSPIIISEKIMFFLNFFLTVGFEISSAR